LECGDIGVIACDLGLETGISCLQGTDITIIACNLALEAGIGCLQGTDITIIACNLALEGADIGAVRADQTALALIAGVDLGLKIGIGVLGAALRSFNRYLAVDDLFGNPAI